jgi:PAS domain S-box-containing protein
VDTPGETVFAHPLQQTLTGTAIVAGDDTVVSWNAWAERLTGYTIEEIYGHRVVPLFDPEDILQRHLQLAHADILTLSDTLRLKQAGGQHVLVEVQCSALHQCAQGEAQVVVVMFQLKPLRERGHRDGRCLQLRDLPEAMSEAMHNPLHMIGLQAKRLKSAVGRPNSTASPHMGQSLHALRGAVAELHQHLEHLRSRTNTLWHEVDDALTVMCLQADLLEEVLQHPAVGGSTWVEQSVQAIKTTAVHLQALVSGMEDTI